MATRRELQQRVVAALEDLDSTRFAKDNPARARSAVWVFEEYVKERGGEMLYEQLFEPEPLPEDD